ncbi:hypothetical protein [Pyrobaculum aerophilum]
MGLMYVDVIVKHGRRSRRVKALVDSGVMYTVLKRGVWEDCA